MSVPPSSPTRLSFPAKSVCSLTSRPGILISPLLPVFLLPFSSASCFSRLSVRPSFLCSHIFIACTLISPSSELLFYLYLVPHCLALSCPSSISCFFILPYLLEFKPCKSNGCFPMCFFWIFLRFFFFFFFPLRGEEYRITLFEGWVQIKELK